MAQRKTALVPGAARGIGRQIALTLAEHGYDLALNYHSSCESAPEVCTEIRRIAGWMRQKSCR